MHPGRTSEFIFVKTLCINNAHSSLKSLPFHLHYLYRLSVKGHGEDGANPSQIWARARVQPGQVTNLSFGEHRDKQSFTLRSSPMGSLEQPDNLICMWEETGSATNSTQKGSSRKPFSFEAARLNTAPPCGPSLWLLCYMFSSYTTFITFILRISLMCLHINCNK